MSISPLTIQLARLEVAVPKSAWWPYDTQEKRSQPVVRQEHGTDIDAGLRSAAFEYSWSVIWESIVEIAAFKNYLTSDGELTAGDRADCWWNLYFLMLCICALFLVSRAGMETPGIQYFGRIVVLLIPFNSFCQLGRLLPGFRWSYPPS